METESLLRGIPKVDEILNQKSYKKLTESYPEVILKDELRRVLDDLRDGIKRGSIKKVPDYDEIIAMIGVRAKHVTMPGLKRVINGTGVVIHTNMGRSLLSNHAVKGIIEVATHYSNLEYDLEKGVRGDRHEHATSLLKRLTGAEAALIVNNNAASVYLVLNTLAEGKEVIISRGELVEIGGSFRIPDVMKKSGAILKEVGTTNRTYIEDYEMAIGASTGMIMKVHTSNYKIKGFVHEVLGEELIVLAEKYNLPSFFDAGSGLFFPLTVYHMANEPSILLEFKKGWGIISFSGDKLLGGPQAGIILGEKSYIDAMKKNPMTRAMRPDKFTLASLERTLLAYLDSEQAKTEIITLRMLYEDKERIKARSKRIVKKLGDNTEKISFSIAELFSQVGGGSLPDVYLPSYGIAINTHHFEIESFEKILRSLEVPIIGRIEKDTLLIDIRTVLPDDEQYLINGIKEAIRKISERERRDI